MRGRHALVIGSQCAAKRKLSFLPGLANELYAVLVDPLLGACEPAAPDLSGPLLDPSLATMQEHLDTAFGRASAAGAALFVAFIGHGEVGLGDSDFFLLPNSCPDPDRPRMDTAWLMGQGLRDLLRTHDRLDGLVMLVDACRSGQGAIEVAERVAPVVAVAQRRLEVLTATDNSPAADGCFTRSLIDLVRRGHPDFGQWVLCRDARGRIECRGQTPQWLAYDGRRRSEVGDPALWLSLNWQRRPERIPPDGSLAAAMLDHLLVGYEAPRELEGLVARARRGRWVSVTGPAGSGKSVLLGGLARPELSTGLVPEGFLHALVFLDATTTVRSLAYDLRDQLQLSVTGYGAAVAEHRRVMGKSWEEQDPLTQLVWGPSAQLLPTRNPVRLALDGIDQLSADVAAELRPALFATAERPELAHVHLIVSSRAEEQRLPESGRRMALEGPDPAVLTRYLEHRRVRPDLARFLATACTRGRSAWLLARLIGDTHLTLTETARAEFARPLYSETDQAGALALLFDHALDVIGAADPIEWSQNLRPVLTPLAAAGAGPVMPLSLLCAASAGFGGPHEPPRVRDVLARLGRLIVRSQPGTDREVVGLFHPTLAEHLAEHARNRVDIGSGRRVLLEEINKLAPVTGLYMDNPLYRWAAEAEAEQLWQLGMIGSALQSLNARPLPTPRENLARWRSWDARVRVRLGPDDENTLRTRAGIAYWTFAAGKAREALRLFQELLPDGERVLGRYHPGTLTTRGNIAAWTGETGKAAAALRLFQQLLPDRERVLGPDHPDTLNTRKYIAARTGETGSAE